MAEGANANARAITSNSAVGTIDVRPTQSSVNILRANEAQNNTPVTTGTEGKVILGPSREQTQAADQLSEARHNQEPHAVLVTFSETPASTDTNPATVQTAQSQEVTRPQRLEDNETYRAFMMDPDDGLRARVWRDVPPSQSMTAEQHDVKAAVLKAQMQKEFAARHPDIWAQFYPSEGTPSTVEPQPSATQAEASEPGVEQAHETAPEPAQKPKEDWQIQYEQDIDKIEDSLGVPRGTWARPNWDEWTGAQPEDLETQWDNATPLQGLDGGRVEPLAQPAAEPNSSPKPPVPITDEMRALSRRIANGEDYNALLQGRSTDEVRTILHRADELKKIRTEAAITKVQIQIAQEADPLGKMSRAEVLEKLLQYDPRLIGLDTSSLSDTLLKDSLRRFMNSSPNPKLSSPSSSARP